jgi:alpha-glucosidase
MWPEAPDSTNGYHPAMVELHLFVPASDGVYQSMLQEDDGLTFAALEGARYRTAFTLARAGAELTLNAGVSGDGYPEFIRERFVLVLHGAAPEEAYLDDTMIIASGGRFEIPNRGVGFGFSCIVPAD